MFVILLFSIQIIFVDHALLPNLSIWSDQTITSVRAANAFVFVNWWGSSDRDGSNAREGKSWQMDGKICVFFVKHSWKSFSLQTVLLLLLLFFFVISFRRDHRTVSLTYLGIRFFPLLIHSAKRIWKWLQVFHFMDLFCYSFFLWLGLLHRDISKRVKFDWRILSFDRINHMSSNIRWTWWSNVFLCFSILMLIYYYNKFT